MRPEDVQAIADIGIRATRMVQITAAIPISMKA